MQSDFCREYDHAITIHDFHWKSVTDYYLGEGMISSFCIV